MNVAQRAFTAAQLGLSSQRELPLSAIGDFKEAPSHTFILNGQAAKCMSRKFTSLKHIQDALSPVKEHVYVYKLYSQDEYNSDLQPTGNRFYILRYCIRK